MKFILKIKGTYLLNMLLYFCDCFGDKMNRRSILLFRLLANSKDFISSDVLCKKLDIRPRTLREELKSFKLYIETIAGAKLITKTNSGYKLEIIDEDKFYPYMQTILKEEANQQFIMPVLQDDRVNYIIRKFLGNDDYLKSEDIADELFIAKSTFSSDLKIVKEKLYEYNLELESKVGYGLKIQGNELDLRQCISQFFFHNNVPESNITDIKFLENYDLSLKEKIAEILYSTIKKANFKLTDFGFQNLVIHLIIAKSRISSKTFFDEKQIDQINIEQTNEYRIAEEIAEQIENDYDISFPKSEIAYIAIHLMGKRVFSQEEDSIIEGSTLNLVRDILKDVVLHFNISFIGDVDLFTALSLHLQPLVNRLKYGLQIHNPLVYHIKEKNPLAYDIALVAYKVIQNKFNCDFNENEVGYIALHFQLALQRNTQLKKQNILVICASGAGTAHILMNKVQTIFKDQIGNIDHGSAFALDEMDLSEYSLILTTIPLYKNYDIPIIQVNYDLDNDDIENVMKTLSSATSNPDFINKAFRKELFFSNLKLDSKELIIHKMCNELSKMTNLPHEFEKSVLEREKLASTDLGNQVAIPHPMRLMLDESFVVVAHLEKPILWGKHKVSVVFLLALQKENSENVDNLSKAILSFTQNDEVINNFKAHLNYESFLQIMNDLYINHSMLPSESIFG